MTLDEHLQSESITLAAFAERCGLTTASLSRISKGKQNITLDTAQAIIDASGGKVTLEGLMAKRAAASETAQ